MYNPKVRIYVLEPEHIRRNEMVSVYMNKSSIIYLNKQHTLDSGVKLEKVVSGTVLEYRNDSILFDEIREPHVFWLKLEDVIKLEVQITDDDLKSDNNFHYSYRENV